MKKLIRKICVVLLILLVLISFITFFTAYYIKETFLGISFEQLLFTVTNASGTNTSVLNEGISFVIIALVITISIFSFIYWFYKKYLNRSLYLRIEIKKLRFNVRLLPFSVWNFIFFNLSISLILIVCSFNLLGIFSYIYDQNHISTLFEEYYVSPHNVDIEFPKKKKNLIFIYVESLESTSASIANGGEMIKSNIPNLENLALENLNFSGNSKVGGALASYGGSWTAGALISYTSGTPLKVPPDAGNLYGLNGNSMPGVYSLGEILEDNGYKNYFLMGSEATFGGRNIYFTQHGNYQIYDYNYAKENNWIDSDYYEWWGFEDRKLFEFAKKELIEISKNDEPFNFTMLTADTHFYDGYLDGDCPVTSEVQYEDVIFCSDQMIYDFIKWVQKQKFYKDTVIIVVGDHLSMQPDFFTTGNRSIFNLFINTDKTKFSKNRQFTNLDMFPTTLAALGAKIEGDRLGLGVNLFSGRETLAEKFGIDEFNLFISYKSIYYNENIVGNTVYEIVYEEGD